MKKVRYIGQSYYDKRFNPYIGAIGYVVEVDDKHKTLLVRWDDDTLQGDRTWWCFENDVEYIEDKTKDEIIVTKAEIDLMKLCLIHIQRSISMGIIQNINSDHISNILFNIMDPLSAMKDGDECKIIMNDKNMEENHYESNN